MTPDRARLRIAFVVTRMDVGGVPDHVMTLLRGLSRRHHLTVIAGEIDPCHEAEMQELGVGIERLPLSRLPDARRDLSALRALRALLRKGRFDIVHTHMSKAALLGVLATRMMPDRPRVVNTAHNLGSLALRNRAARGVFWVYDKILLGWGSDTVIVVSQRVREQVLALRLMSSGHVTAIPNGIRLDRFDVAPGDARKRRMELSVADGAVLVICVARLVWFKGLDTLVAAFSRVAVDFPAARLCIVGDGPLREQLEAQASSCGIGERVMLIGERRDVPSLLSASDLFVLPSVSEGMPISILEAMAAGRATLATDVGGVRELVLDGETGLVVPSGDVDALAAALLLLIRDKALRETMGAAALARARSDFDGAAMAARTEALYCALVERREGAS